jgi:hypothetical protein
MENFSGKRFIRIGIKAIIASTLVIFICINAGFVAGSKNDLYDFGSFIASGQFANSGQNPYSIESPLILKVEFPKINRGGVSPNLNPPVSVMLFQMIANTNPYKSAIVWRILSAILYLLSILLLYRFYRENNSYSLWLILWALSLAGFWQAILLGQIYIPFVLTAVGAWILIKKEQSLWGGILLGMLIAIKPNFIFWALALMTIGNWGVFISAGVTATLISATPLFFYGGKIYIQWLQAVAAYTPNMLIFPGNNSLQGLTSRFGSAQAGAVLSVILGSAILLYIFKNKPSMISTNALGILTSLLISPLTWPSYTLLTLPIFFEKAGWTWRLWMAAFLFAIPFYFPLKLFQESFFNFVFFGWFYGWGLLLLLADTLIEIKKQPEHDS